MITQYVKQKDGYGCGPTALANILRWLGRKVDWRSKPKHLYKKCQTDENGTYTSGMWRALKSYKSLKASFRTRTNITQIRNHLRRGGVVLIAYEYKRRVKGKYKWFSHYTVIVKEEGKYFYLANDGHLNKPLSRKTRPVMKSIIDYLLEAWFISKA
jgi:predicted double-glycine peptidase